MRRISALALLLVVSLWSAAYAVSSATISTSAAVPSVAPDMSILVFELTSPGQNPFTGVDVTAQGMQFGDLTHTLPGGVEAGLWFSSKYYAVMIFTNGFGNRYQVTSTCAGLTSGATSLPAGSFGLTPGYAALDEFSPGVPQGPQPVGSVLGTAGPAITTGKVIYQSETAGSGRILRAFYSIPPLGAGGTAPYPGHQAIPLTQPAGTYAGQVVVTIAAF